jgi:hypothetical protein
MKKVFPLHGSLKVSTSLYVSTHDEALYGRGDNAKLKILERTRFPQRIAIDSVAHGRLLPGEESWPQTLMSGTLLGQKDGGMLHPDPGH